MFIPNKSQIDPIVEAYGSPVFVTDAAVIRTQAKYLLEVFEGMNMKMFYAVKANFNPSVVKVIKDSGIYGIDAVSPNEVQMALELGYTPDQIIFTPSNPSTAEIKEVSEKGVLQNLGSLSELKRLGEVARGSKVSIRICPEVGGGEFDKVNTGGMNTKFGITMDDIEAVRAVCTEYDLKLVGIHSHIGSGFYEPEGFASSVEAVCEVARKFETTEFVDFGGGFGVQYDPNKAEIDLSQFAESIKPIIASYESDTQKTLELRIEPGKILVSQSTVLCTTVTTLKAKGDDIFVGINSGFANYMRPAMYGAYQHFVNVSNPDGAMQKVQIAGNVCETCDIFNHGLDINTVREGDVLAMLVAGGYGSAMSSNYNLRPTLPEVMIDGDSVKLTRKGQSYEDIMNSYITQWK